MHHVSGDHTSNVILLSNFSVYMLYFNLFFTCLESRILIFHVIVKIFVAVLLTEAGPTLMKQMLKLLAISVGFPLIFKLCCFPFTLISINHHLYCSKKIISVMCTSRSSLQYFLSAIPNMWLSLFIHFTYYFCKSSLCLCFIDFIYSLFLTIDRVLQAPC